MSTDVFKKIIAVAAPTAMAISGFFIANGIWEQSESEAGFCCIAAFVVSVFLLLVWAVWDFSLRTSPGKKTPFCDIDPQSEEDSAEADRETALPNSTLTGSPQTAASLLLEAIIHPKTFLSDIDESVVVDNRYFRVTTCYTFRFPEEQHGYQNAVLPLFFQERDFPTEDLVLADACGNKIVPLESARVDELLAEGICERIKACSIFDYDERLKDELRHAFKNPGVQDACNLQSKIQEAISQLSSTSEQIPSNEEFDLLSTVKSLLLFSPVCVCLPTEQVNVLSDEHEAAARIVVAQRSIPLEPYKRASNNTGQSKATVRHLSISPACIASKTMHAVKRLLDFLIRNPMLFHYDMGDASRARTYHLKTYIDNSEYYERGELQTASHLEGELIPPKASKIWISRPTAQSTPHVYVQNGSNFSNTAFTFRYESRRTYDIGIAFIAAFSSLLLTLVCATPFIACEKNNLAFTDAGQTHYYQIRDDDLIRDGDQQTLTAERRENSSLVFWSLDTNLATFGGLFAVLAAAPAFLGLFTTRKSFNQRGSSVPVWISGAITAVVSIVDVVLCFCSSIVPLDATILEPILAALIAIEASNAITIITVFAERRLALMSISKRTPGYLIYSATNDGTSNDATSIGKSYSAKPTRNRWGEGWIGSHKSSF